MKPLIAVLSILCLVSCTKEAETIPQSNIVSSLFYKDANITVDSFTATKISSSTVSVNYIISSETSVEKLELMSGNDSSQLCTIYSSGISDAIKKYSYNDSNIKGATMYYMLRYTLTNGNWSYTPVCSVDISK
jgi:hypothetical protein